MNKKKNNFLNLNLPDKILGVEKAFLVLFLPLFGLLVLFLISLNLVLLPKVNEIGEISKNINDIKAKTAKIQEQNDYLASVDQEKLNQIAGYLNDAVLKDKQSYVLVEIIRSVANNFNYQVQSFSLNPGELKNEETTQNAKLLDTVKMPVTLSMIGPKENILDLISALEKTLPVLFIDKFETRNSGLMLQLNLVVSSYYIKDSVNVETNNLSLNDLIMSKEELDLIDRISAFTKIENNQTESDPVDFQKYQRENPFSL